MKLTIFTPTFNRAYTLGTLYKSLLQQTNKNFVWMIIDDGSTDSTKDLVQKYIEEKIIHINYKYQRNVGKMQTHNNAVVDCSTELFICVDSDDYITENSVETILQVWESRVVENISGLIFYRGTSHRVPIGTAFPDDLKLSTLSNLYKTGFKGDTSLVYRTSLLKLHFFPNISGEKFIPEDYIYDQIDQNYQMLIVPKIIIITEYLQDGYTRNMTNLLKKNPVSWSLYHLQKSAYSKKAMSKCYHIIQYISFLIYANQKGIIKQSKKKVLTILLFPFGYLNYLKKVYLFRNKS